MKLDIVTGSRAEYGIMRNLIKEIVSDSYFNQRIIVTGMHLEKKYGYTINDLKNDNLNIDKEISSNMTDTSELGTLNSYEKTFQGFKEYYIKNKPDAVLILGDRYEIYAVANVCGFLKIPLIHLHGGERTEGNYDEYIRHSITKIAKLHFVAAEEFQNRVIQLGEDPQSVYNVGALGVENIKNSKLKNIEELNFEYNIKLENKKYFVVAFHPETLSKDNKTNEDLLKVLKNYKDEYDFVFIGSNSDTGSDVITKNIENFIKENKKGILIPSTSSINYYSFIKNSIALIGNSSSGLIEAPSLGALTINIGDRQKGRLRGPSVIDVKNEEQEINDGIQKAINNKNEKYDNPYEGINTKDEIIKKIKLNEENLKNSQKVFFDIKC